MAKYLHSAEYSSHKQVGVLVHVQDGEVNGRVGAGRSGHHPSHRAFQRIHRYGPIQPFPTDREKVNRPEEGCYSVCTFCVTSAVIESVTTVFMNLSLHFLAAEFYTRMNRPPRSLFSEREQPSCIAEGDILKTDSPCDSIGKHLWEISKMKMCGAGGTCSLWKRWPVYDISFYRRTRSVRLHCIYVMMCYGLPKLQKS